jgi:hypothetical protein
MSFPQIEGLVGSLPQSAMTWSQRWWTNVETGHAQSRAWLEAGYRVAGVDLEKRSVRFVKVQSNE